MSHEIPKAIWEGSFNLFGIDIKCFVLNDGRRIIDADDLHRLFEAMADPNCQQPTKEELASFAKWQSGKA